MDINEAYSYRCRGGCATLIHMKIGGIFMKNNIFKAYLLTGAITLGVIGAAHSTAFAATNSNTAPTDGIQGLKLKMHQNLDDATKEKIQTIMDDAKAKLAELGVTLPEKFEKGNRFANLDDATKEKVQAIMDKVKDGSLTHEDAQKLLAELGVNLPFGHGGMHGDAFANLDDATKEKAQAIMDKVKDGSLTREDAQKQLAELGVDLPSKRGSMHGERFANLDEATKEKAQAIMDKVKDGSLTREDAQKQLAELGVQLPARGGKHVDPFANLDNATKAKAQDIMDEAKTQIKELIEE